MKSAHRGMILLEVMLGTAILGMAGVALVTLLTQTVEAVRTGRERERQAALATEAMNRITLWDGAQFDARVGIARNGPWNVTIAIAAPHVYAIAISDTVADAVVLRTKVYRPVRVLDAP